MSRYSPANVKKLKRYSVKDRLSKVDVGFLGKVHSKGESFAGFLDSLPEILVARDFKAVVKAIVSARMNGKPVILGMGAHPIKVGLSPIIIDLMERSVITAVATNGACIVHDFEMSYVGQTSEDVGPALCKGEFGMAKETGSLINKAINIGAKKNLGLGESIGEFIHKSRFKQKAKSIFRTAFVKDIPATVHVAIGADIIHMHPEADGACIGKTSMKDFLLFADVLGGLDGGVYINLGSAVIMPEVFLKALNIARNLGSSTENITTVNMDFVQHYRPKENVLHRPTMHKGKAYAITGHHEIMFPLLAASVIESL